VDAKAGRREEVRAIAASLGASGRRCWLVLNKTDLVPAPALLPLIATLTALAPFEETFMVSAGTGDGVRNCPAPWPPRCRRDRSCIPRTT
jgi:GTP-binding protein Era